MKQLVILLGVVASFSLTLPASATVISIDDSSANGFSTTGTWTKASARSVGGEYSYPIGGDSPTATYTPSAVSGFAPGAYGVYVNWGVYSANLGATYTVNYAGSGTYAKTFDNSKNAAQGVSNHIGATSESGGGYYYLGSFNLDASSNVVLSGITGSSGQADAVMFRQASDGRFLDQQSTNLTTNDSSAWAMAGESTMPSGNAHYTTTAGVTATWTSLASSAGLYDIKASWGVYNTHSTNVKYLVDIDGNGVQDAEDALFTIDQTKHADQATSVPTDGAYWSDYCDFGTFSLTSASKIIQYRDGSAAMTVGPMVVTSVPEPSAFVLYSSALLGFLAYACQKRKTIA